MPEMSPKVLLQALQCRCILFAINLSIPWICKAVASANPPKNRNIIGFANDFSAFAVSNNPKTTASRGINNAVIVTCIASVSHKIPINTNRQIPAFALESNGKNLYKIKNKIIFAIIILRDHFEGWPLIAGLRGVISIMIPLLKYFLSLTQF